MTDHIDKTQLVMTPKAACAFDAYVNLSGKRSYRKLADQLTQQGLYRNATGALRTIAKWATVYAWQDRLAVAVSVLTRKRLEEAHELDAASFRITSQLLHERLEYTTHHHLDAIIDIRSAVKLPTVKGEVSGTIVHDHQHSGVVKVAHHDLSGLTPEQIDALIALQRSRLPETSEVGS